MKRRKTMEEICAMPTLEAWRVTLDQLPKTKLPEHRYAVLVDVCGAPFIMADDVDEAVKLLTMIRDHFTERMSKNIGDPQQNGCIFWLCTCSLGKLESL